MLDSKPLAADMFYFPVVILVYGLHDKFYQQRGFLPQFPHIDSKGVIRPVYRLPVMQEVRHLDREFYRLVRVFDVERIIGPILRNDGQVTLTREIPQGGFDPQHVFRPVRFRRQEIRAA